MEAIKQFVIHYHEIALKGKNRRFFVDKLAENINRAVHDVSSEMVKVLHDRILLKFGGDEAQEGELKNILKHIPGVANFLISFRVERDMELLKKRVVEEVGNPSAKSFKIETNRSDKTYELTSEDVCGELGAHVKEKTGMKVDLENPELTIYVEIIAGSMMFSFEKIKGVGGLPVGSSGRVVSLLSGGIDSPVASYLAMKRGCRVVFVHFHSFPYTDNSSAEKAKELMQVLNKYQGESRLYLVPFGDIQKTVVTTVPEEYRVIVYRRLMIKIACEIAKREKAKTIVTGENLGQVASQTLENISTINDASEFLILRPLICDNKEDTIRQAKDIGTYDISILPDSDCCQLFTPKHPATMSNVKTLEKIESELDVSAQIADALGKVEMVEYKKN